MADAKRAVRESPEPAWSDWWRLHLWQIQPVRDILLLGAVLALVYLGSLMSVVTVPLLLGLALAYLFEPVIERMSRRMSRKLAVAIVLVGMVVAIGVPIVVGTGFAAVQGAEFLHELREDLPRLREKTREFAEEVESRGALFALFGIETDRPAGDTLPESDPEPTPEHAPADPPPPTPDAGENGAVANGKPPAENGKIEAGSWDVFAFFEAWLEQNANAIGQTVAGSGANVMRAGWRLIGSLGYIAFTLFFLTPLFFFFISTGYGRVKRLFQSMIPHHERAPAIAILRKMDLAISGFVRGRLVIATIVSVILTTGWWLCGVPAPLILGPATGFLNIVPYLGMIGWIISLIGMWVVQAGEPEPMTWWMILLLPTAVYWTAQTIDDYVLTPLIQGKTTGLNTPMILVALLGGGAIGGVYGLLLAIPAAACVRILVTDVVWPRYKAWAEGLVRDPLPIGDSSRP